MSFCVHGKMEVMSEVGEIAIVENKNGEMLQNSGVTGKHSYEPDFFV
jgi:hypothetical protein